VKYHLNWTNKSYAYAPRVDFPVGSYEIVLERDEGPFKGGRRGVPQDPNQSLEGPKA
jgi:hypothetical protein